MKMGCIENEGEPCDPTDYYNQCSSMWSDSQDSCRACPETSGFGSHEGYCSAGYETSETVCASLYGGYSGGGDDGTSSSSDCGESVWTCEYDGQATPMCQWACTYSGSERSQTCEVLASMLESGDPSECCTVCP